MDLEGKLVIVVGLGLSGVAAARLCLKRGARVVGVDEKRYDVIGPEARALGSEGATLVLGGVGAAPFVEADLVVMSPGVPAFPALRAAEARGVPVISEVELSFRTLPKSTPVIAIGGTNGKSTTTALIAELLTATGRKVFLGGNYGEPLAGHVDEPFDAVVLEVSSFQMERVDAFRPKVSVLLNVTPDHLDRYPSLEAYAHAKGNSFARQGDGDVAVVPYGDAVCIAQAKRGRGKIVTFGPGGDVAVTDDAVTVASSGERYARDDFGLSGGHNALNVAAALAAVAPFGIASATIRSVLASFQGLPHRTAYVATIHGARYYDDSKGTNVGAAVTALLGLREPRAVLIAGGRAKGGSYAPLVEALRQKGRGAVLIGEAADALALAIGDAVPVVRAKTMAEAVEACAKMAQAGDAVLLSPACSSFDMFRDYKHRGDEFVRHVLDLRERPSA